MLSSHDYFNQFLCSSLLVQNFNAICWSANSDNLCFWAPSSDMLCFKYSDAFQWNTLIIIFTYRIDRDWEWTKHNKLTAYSQRYAKQLTKTIQCYDLHNGTTKPIIGKAMITSIITTPSTIPKIINNCLQTWLFSGTQQRQCYIVIQSNITAAHKQESIRYLHLCHQFIKLYLLQNSH